MRSPMTIPRYIEHIEYRIHYYTVQLELAEDKEFWQHHIDKDHEEYDRVLTILRKYCNG